ncbi:hypothetical protein CPter291_3129 [Collimonas pratensis]|uniref:Uncharacterized protein n=1 Tax=Collimonas pratensis TaxID=279113 RepID=A0A127Q3I3_9BURK|nr:hypothetical protein CPter91_2210 [Collimonas pratensis]AMP15365.1 hypothetical protein CPter291_3129 [Collimonas pratensis]
MAAAMARNVSNDFMSAPIGIWLNSLQNGKNIHVHHERLS